MYVLDLYCGAGGSSVGIKRAGADHILGMDIEYQPEYPFWFQQVDISKIFRVNPRFGFVWASPPCQAYSYAAAQWRNKGKTWPDLIDHTRTLLDDMGLPYVIENTAGAPIRHDLMLCGEMFGLKVIRHRYFELSGFSCQQPEHKKHRGMVKDGFYVTVAGNGGDYAGHNFCKLNDLPGASQLQTWQYAMGIDWMQNKKSLREAVPPAYAEYIFNEFIKDSA